MTRVSTIDCEFLGESGHTAAYLLEQGGEAAYIDNNTTHVVPRLLRHLDSHGLRAEDVRYVVITHVHLDHAGGTSELMKACPHATLLAHPLAARHMVDPTALLFSAAQVYGQQRFHELYGEIEPVPEHRVQSVQDGEAFPLGTAQLTFLFTPGHASHHVCIHESDTNGIFTGDAFGTIYPALQAYGLLAYPSTSPTDFDASQAQDSLRRIDNFGADRLYLTHFGEHTKIREAAMQLHAHLEFARDLERECIHSALPDDELAPLCQRRWRTHMTDVLAEHGGLHRDPEAWRIVELDVELNAQGVAFSAVRARKRARHKCR
jgi:glyoxylase-like metal-dependent hydrolase (beta-lactamase superfamily II)